MTEHEPEVELTELENYKIELTTFLRESCDALHARAKTLPVTTQKERYAAIELVNQAMAFINLVSLIENGAFDG